MGAGGELWPRRSRLGGESNPVHPGSRTPARSPTRAITSWSAFPRASDRPGRRSRISRTGFAKRLGSATISGFRRSIRTPTTGTCTSRSTRCIRSLPQRDAGPRSFPAASRLRRTGDQARADPGAAHTRPRAEPRGQGRGRSADLKRATADKLFWPGPRRTPRRPCWRPGMPARDGRRCIRPRQPSISP